MKKLLILTITATLSFAANAQTSFSWGPNDTIIQTVDPDLYTEMLIEQVNQTDDTLHLGVEVVYNDAPSTWDGMICIYGMCLGAIQPVGFTAEMSPIMDSINGYTKLTVYPAGGLETMKLRIRVYDINNPTDGDTCTWIVNSLPLEVNEFEASPLTVYPNPTNSQLTIESPNQVSELRIYDMFGREVMKTNVEQSLRTTINVEGLTPGAYFVNALSDGELTGIKRIQIHE